MTLDAAVRQLAAAGIESPRAEARLLLAHAMGITRDESLCAPPPTPQQEAAFAAMVARRATREPSAYITGHKEFWSLEFQVGPGVLVPRPDSETLIEEALRAMPNRTAPLVVADLGTGSGALLIAMLHEFPHARGIGFESSPQAFPWAQRNAARLMPARAEIRLEGWHQAPEGHFDLILCNPPYIPAGEIAGLEPEVTCYEPHAALDGGPDGLAAFQDLAGLLPRLLKKRGRAIVEIGAGQGPAMEPMFEGSGAKLMHTTPDLAGIPRAVLLEKA